MSERETTPKPESVDHQAGPWIAGFAIFAAIVLITVGVFQALEGLVFILRKGYYVVTPRYLFGFDVTAWGWTHLIIGILLVAVGAGVLGGHLWARIIAVVLAVLSAIANFMFLPYYPIWSTIIIALDMLVIWGLCRYTPQVAGRNAVRY